MTAWHRHGMEVYLQGHGIDQSGDTLLWDGILLNLLHRALQQMVQHVDTALRQHIVAICTSGVFLVRLIPPHTMPLRTP